VEALEPSVTPDGRRVIFTLPTRGRDVECSVSREALEQHFWVQPEASETRILRAFEDGRKRIVAIAERKMLAHAGERIVLTAADFDTRK
jgi:Protein of unknown function (DUF1488)